jgi:hypothetical protein
MQIQAGGGRGRTTQRHVVHRQTSHGSIQTRKTIRGIKGSSVVRFRGVRWDVIRNRRG